MNFRMSPGCNCCDSDCVCVICNEDPSPSTISLTVPNPTDTDCAVADANAAFGGSWTLSCNDEPTCSWTGKRTGMSLCGGSYDIYFTAFLEDQGATGGGKYQWRVGATVQTSPASTNPTLTDVFSVHSYAALNLDCEDSYNVPIIGGLGPEIRDPTTGDLYARWGAGGNMVIN